MTSRQEVAKKWRETGERLDKEPPSSLTGTACITLFELLESAGIRDNNSYSDVFNRLADLIDPTCEGIHRREPDDIDGTPRYTIHCSNCGQLLDETSGIPHSPMYCLNCGTRIIRGCLYSQSEDSSEVVQD